MNSRNKNHLNLKFLIFIIISILHANIGKATDNSWDMSDRGPLGGNIQAAAIDPQNQDKVYIGTMGGGFYWTDNFQNSQPSWHQKNDNLLCWNILSLMIKGNKIYAGTTCGLFCLDLANIRSANWLPYFEDQLGTYTIFRLRNCEDSQHPEAFYAMGYDAQNNGYQRKLIIIEDIKKPPYFASSDLTNANVFDVAPYRQKEDKNHDKLGQMFVATDDGLYRFNDFLNSADSYIHVLSNTTINCIAERMFLRSPADTAFIVYAGTPQGGKFSVLENQEEPWKEFLKDSAITHLEPWFSNTVILDDGKIVRIYAITQGSHIFYKDEITYEDVQIWPEDSSKGLFSPSINSFAVHDNNTEFLLAGSDDGTYSNINNANWKSKNSENLFAHRIHAIIDSDNRLWCGSDGMLFDRQIGIDPNWIEKKIFKYITTIASHPGANKIYFGTKGEGVFWTDIESASVVPFNRGQLPDNSSISALKIEQKTNPNIYVGTEDGKIYRYESSGWKELVVLDPEKVMSIAIDSVQMPDGNVLYVSMDQKVYRINSNDHYSPVLPPSWNANSEVNSIVFNNKTSYLFAGTSRGIKFHSVNDEIGKNWSNYQSLALSDSNVQRLHVIPTDPAFKGVLYAMTSDSAKRFSRIWRNVIGTDIKAATIGYPYGQYGESFCVNSNNPNIVYLGTAGTGVFKYEFEQSKPPYVRPGPIDFGNIPQNTTKSDTITIKNYNSFSPLIFLFELGDTANFKLNLQDSIVVYPGECKTCSLTFKPQKYEDIKSSLRIKWRDIFIHPVMQGSQTIALSGTGKGADFIIDGKADSILFYNFKIHIGDTLKKTLNWKKIGNIAFQNFRVCPPTKPKIFELVGNWQGTFNKNDSGNVQLLFHPPTMNTIPEVDSAVIIYDLIGQRSNITKTIRLSGKGLDARLITEKQVIFDDIPAGDKSHIKSIALKNEGNVPLIVNTAKVLPEGSPFFIDRSDLIPDTIQANQLGIFLNLGFSPKKIDSFHDSLIIIYHDSSLACFDDTIIVDLIGNGVEHKIEPFPLEALNFGTVHAKKLPNEGTIYVKNISTRFTVWVDGQILQKNEVFRLVNPHAFVLPPYNGVTYNQDSLKIEFFINPAKELKALLKPHEDQMDICYRYGNQHQDSIKIEAIRQATLTGTIISSLRVGGDKTGWKPITPIDTSIDTSFIFQNIGNIPLNFKIMISPSNPPWKLLLATSKIYELQTDEEIGLNVKFSPIDLLKSDLLKIHFWDVDVNKDTCMSDVLTFSLVGTGIDNIRPIIDSLKFSSPVWKQPDTVTARIRDKHSGLVMNSLQLFIRKGGDDDFTALNMQVKSLADSTYYVVIPGEKITSRGIEFFIKAVDSSGTENYYPPNETEFRYLSPPVIITPPGITKTKDFDDDAEIEFLEGGSDQHYYQFISIPLDNLNYSAKEILNESFGLKDFHSHRWRCIDYQFDAAIGKTRRLEIDTYAFDKPFSDFAPGKSFLLLIDYRYPKRSIQRQTGITVTTAQKFEYQLHNGWNFVGNPFNFRIPISHISLAKQEQFILYAYEGGWIEYDSLDAPKRFLFPWEGAAIYSERENTLLICPNLDPRYGPTELSRPIEKPEYEWFISIGAFCQQAKDVNNIAAVSKTSSLGLDNFDAPEPPAIGEFVKLSFPHPAWGQICDEYAKDVKSPTEQAFCWDFDVITNISNSEISLIFNNVATVPNDFQVFVICEELNMRQNLRKNDKMIFRWANNFVEHHFKLIVGKESFINSYADGSDLVPKDYKLHASYPNPFWMSAEIKYEIPQQERITIAIYNLLGELIKTIDHGTRLAGRYSVFWDGTDDKNLLVRNGVYFCKFTAPNFSQTIKMTLLR